MQLVQGFDSRNLRGDFFGGLTAAVVALPLALAFGVSSGLGAIAGLYGSIFVGFFAALFGGTPSQVSGPTGPMTAFLANTVLVGLVALHPDDPKRAIPLALGVVILSGLFQVLCGVLRLGKYITLIPYTVISGFMSGIGVLIVVPQLAPLLGLEFKGSVLQTLQALPRLIPQTDPTAFALGGLTLLIVFCSPAKLNRLVPAPLLALVICTAVSLFLPGASGLERIGDIPSGLPSPQFPQVGWEDVRPMLGYAVMLGTLGAIDSLLTSLVADNITRTQHDSDRELIGQGIGNCISGAMGGLPGAGATMRTVINAQAGGKTPLSGMFHALALLVITLGAGDLTASIPVAVLAGILFKVGVDIVDWGFLLRAHRISWRATGIMYGVMFLTAFVNLVLAVGVGMFVANILTLQSLTELQMEQVRAVTDPADDELLSDRERELLGDAHGRIMLFRLGGPMSFGAAKAISRRMAIVKDYDVLILDVSDVPLLGVTASLAIETMVKEARSKKREVFLVGATGRIRRRLQRLRVMELLPPSHQMDSRLVALEAAAASLQELPSSAANVASL